MLTANEVRDMISYDPASGIFRWRQGGPGRAAGSIAGCLSSDGYWRLKFHYRKYAAARVAWIYMTGEWPTHQMDHIDCDRANNRWSNLREATQSQNNANRRVARSKFSRIKGVHRKRNHWEASIQKDGRSHYLGCFQSPEDAQAAYRSAAQSLFGEYAKC